MSVSLPPEAILEWHTIKPSAFALFCLMCQVKDSRSDDLFISPEKAATHGIHKTAYYDGLKQLENKKWIKFAGVFRGKKRYKLLKGFVQVSANAETDPENSANAENQIEDSANAESKIEDSAFAENGIPQTRKTDPENSANAEFPSNSPIRMKFVKEEKFTNAEEAKRACECAARAHGKNAHESAAAAGNSPPVDSQIFEEKPEIPADDEMFRVLETPEDFRFACESGIKLRLRTPVKLPKESEWSDAFEFWLENGYESAELLETFDLVDRIRILRRKPWQMSAGVLKNNIGKLGDLRRELENLENSGEQENAIAKYNRQPFISTADRRSQSAIDEYEAVEQLRIAAEQRRAKRTLPNNARSGG